MRSYKYYDFVMAGFVTSLLCANLIGVGKITTIAGWTFGAGILFFPLAYVFGDVLTEVYGYARARRVVWAGMAAQIFASIMAFTVVTLPPAEGYANQAALETVFGSTWRIVGASIFAYFLGEFSNSFVLAKMKVKTAGRHLWARTIGSTIVGEALDTAIFYPLAFYGSWPNDLLLSVMLSNYVMKVLWEVLATPVTYRVVSFLKKAENEDFFDRDTAFTPFRLDVK